ncbi:signal peptide peptidase SppA [Thermosulfuriphilus sp.]
MRSSPIVVGLAFLGALFLFLILLMIALGFLLSRGTPVLPGADRIGVIEVKGLISESDRILKDLRHFRDRKDIKAVVIRVESPGGSVGASQEIYQAIRDLSAIKPTVVSMGSVAASGGYYVSLGAEKIYANPGTITGSIGVIMKLPNLGELLKKLGISTTTIKSGRFKDLTPVTRNLTEEERALLQGLLTEVHQQFIAAVAEARRIPVEEVRRLADGRIFTGREAKARGLIDELGNLDSAVEAAAQLAGITGPVELVYPPRERFSLLRTILGEGTRALSQAVTFSGIGYLAPQFVN